MRTKVHPIQLAFTQAENGAQCDLCGAVSEPRYPETPARVTHLVHLVREHLPEVNATFTPKGRSEEVYLNV